MDERNGSGAKRFDKKPDAKKAGGKSFEKKGFGKKPFEKKPLEKRSFDKKPFDKKPFDPKNMDRKPVRGGSYAKKPRGAGRAEQKPAADRARDVALRALRDVVRENAYAAQAVYLYACARDYRIVFSGLRSVLFRTFYFVRKKSGVIAFLSDANLRTADFKIL